jgi:pyruvate formate lyase activating enzyme
MKCDLCPHGCDLADGQTGFCGARKNSNGKNICANYGRVSSLALDPIEKKPLALYKSGSRILSVGSFGCNFRCPFCQNHAVSLARLGSDAVSTFSITPEEIAAKAESLVSSGNIGVAYTYNEPLIGYELVYDTARLVKKRGLDNVIVTNGCINAPYFEKILPFIDAMNIDLKAFSRSFYEKIAGNLETVKKNIALAFGKCHIEITCLIIPNENDSETEMDALSGFLASISPDTPLHITRFFPRYRYSDREPTPLETLHRLKAVADKNLRNVFLGNV